MPNAVVATTVCVLPLTKSSCTRVRSPGLQPGVVVLGANAVAAQDARQLLRRAARARVDDRGAGAEPAQPVHEDREPVLGVPDLLDVVAEIRADDARVHDVGTAAERLADRPRGLRCRRGGHSEERRIAELGEPSTDEEVVRAEVVPPHAHAVHLVHDDESDPDRAQRLDEARLPKPLRRRVDEPLPPGRDLGEPRSGLLRRKRRVHERRGRRHRRGQLVDLVLHQRDQRREDEGRLGAQHRRELVRERLAGTGRHQCERVATFDGSANDLFLTGTKRVEAEELAEGERQIGQAGEYREAAVRRRNSLQSS